MNAAGYCHDLPGEQANPLEVSLTYGMSIYANWLLPSDIAKSTVVISKRMIEGYGCAPAGFASQGVAASSRFFIEGTTQKNSVPMHGPVSHASPTAHLAGDALQVNPYSLAIKTHQYAHQRERRMIGSQPVKYRLMANENNPGCNVNVH